MRKRLDVFWCCKGGVWGYVIIEIVFWNLMWKGLFYVLDILSGREFESFVLCSL